MKLRKKKAEKDTRPQWQKNWDKLPTTKDQLGRGVRNHPDPKYPPDLGNHDRMLIRAEDRKLRKERERAAARSNKNSD